MVSGISSTIAVAAWLSLGDSSLRLHGRCLLPEFEYHSFGRFLRSDLAIVFFLCLLQEVVEY